MASLGARNSLSYRPDLDGLRGIAVGSVVAYHLGAPFASGGFVGVDIFFVLSGFLITRLIASELEAGSFSIAGFYDRRIRRIVPALVFVCACTTALALAILLPDELQRFASSLIATAFSVSNFWCLFNSGYFDPGAEVEPLFHTWSLGIEEQFYILFPVLLWAAFRLQRKSVGAIVLILFAASLLASIVLLGPHPQSTFFMLHTRAWELLTGSIVALRLVPQPASRLAREAGSALGLFAVAAALFGYTSETPFPGLAALLPCIGAGLVIWAGEAESLSARILCARPLVYLGLISYSIYLWHWPLIVFAKLLNIESLSVFHKIAVAFASTALATVTWRFVEQPFRRRVGFSRPAILWSGGLGLGTLAAIALYFTSLHGLPDRFSGLALDLAGAQRDWSPLRTKCHFDGSAKGTYDDTCVLGDDVPPKTIVYADSHGAEFSAALGTLAKSRNESVREITASACPPAADFDMLHREQCAQYNAAIMAKLISISPATIIIAANSVGWASSMPERYWQGLRTTLAALSGAGHRLIVLGPVPHLPNHMPAPATLARWTDRGNDPADFRFSRDVAKFTDVDAKLKEVASEVHATYVPLAPVFCTDDRCSAYLDNAVLYSDYNHLSMRGASLLAQKLLVPVLWPEANSQVLAGTQSLP